MSSCFPHLEPGSSRSLVSGVGVVPELHGQLAWQVEQAEYLAAEDWSWTQSRKGPTLRNSASSVEPSMIQTCSKWRKARATIGD